MLNEQVRAEFPPIRPVMCNAIFIYYSNKLFFPASIRLCLKTPRRKRENGRAPNFGALGEVGEEVPRTAEGG